MGDQMNTLLLDGKIFLKITKAGYDNLKAHEDEVDELNVFPIPDGDTGKNMCATLLGGISALSKIEIESLGEIATAFSRGTLLGARGNSGVILSQMIAGICDYISDKETATVYDIAKALENGVKRAYSSVAKPVEGTMLTVLREATERTVEILAEETTLENLATAYLEEVEASVLRTPDLLPVLKEAGVVDSGGVGVKYVVEGICKALRGEEIVSTKSEVAVTQDIDFSKFTEDSVMEFGYCTEFLLQLQNSKTDVNNFSVENLIAFLETVGDSIVAFITGTVVKVHVHTLTPGKVIEHCQQFGEFLTMKMENMTLQHNESSDKKKAKVFKKNIKRKPYGLVTVVSGEGIATVMRDMGVDAVIDGGQGNNPSVEDFLSAYDAVNADTIFVLPNNGNIIMAAKNAAELFEGSEIIVVPTKSIGEGYSALSMLDLDSSNKNAVLESMEQGLGCSVTGLVSRSIRDVSLGEVDVKKDDYIGFVEKKILVSNVDKIYTATELLQKLGADEKEFIIAFYGADATEAEREQFKTMVQENYPRSEFYEMDGGQEVYDFVIVLQ